MSHGMGAQKDMGLGNYGAKFAQNGIATLIFDYRTFGGTRSPASNTMRNFIYPWHHVEDIQTVLGAVRRGVLGLEVDPSRICLWGSSFSGGHVIVVGASDQPDDQSQRHQQEEGGGRALGLKCLVSQVPYLDGRAASLRAMWNRGFVNSFRIASIAVMDYLRGRLGYSPLYVKIAGAADEVAFMSLPQQSLTEYFSKHPKHLMGGWSNLAPARTLIMLSAYNPIKSVERVGGDLPILFVAAKNDELCPLANILEAAKKVCKSLYML